LVRHYEEKQIREAKVSTAFLARPPERGQKKMKAIETTEGGKVHALVLVTLPPDQKTTCI